ncbi:MAG TPA: nicotinate-nucleotide adenylyltransferase [Chloroflexota bacterium]|nr:nicotinate-nucleotide adenylyltransferase [Chloroflexota bacterium]
MKRRLGVIGGTFDPIHLAHLVAAQEAAYARGLDEVLFVPAAEPPHKRGEPVTDVRHRLAMTRLAIADNPRFRLSTIETDRGGVSYTVDTLRALAAEGDDLCFIVGMDSLADLPAWHDPAGILALAEIAAVFRSGWERFDVNQLVAKIPSADGRIALVEMPALDISSTEIRRRVAASRPIRYFVPDAVAAYIDEHGLYRG